MITILTEWKSSEFEKHRARAAKILKAAKIRFTFIFYDLVCAFYCSELLRMKTPTVLKLCSSSPDLEWILTSRSEKMISTLRVPVYFLLQCAEMSKTMRPRKQSWQILLLPRYLSIRLDANFVLQNGIPST
jgi:hypothetical protein